MGVVKPNCRVTLARDITGPPFHNSIAGVGVDITTQIVRLRRRKIMLFMWDVAGQKSDFATSREVGLRGWWNARARLCVPSLSFSYEPTHATLCLRAGGRSFTAAPRR